MADNTVINLGAGGDTIATDDIAGVKHQRVKVEFGLDGVATDVSASNPLPVTGPLTDTQLRAAAVPISAASLPLPASAATDRATAAAPNSARLSDGTAFYNAANTGQLPAALAAGGGLKIEGVAAGVAVPVSGTVALAAGAAVVGALTANQTVDVARFNGVVPLMGNGIAGTGAQRVAIASDNTAFPVNSTLTAETTKVIGTVNIAAAQTVGLVAGAAVIGALTANQSVNNAQIAGVATSAGNGVSGTGVQRVTLASDGTGQVVLAAGTAIVGQVRPYQALNYVNRNFFLLVPTVAPVAEALISLTQYYSNAAVAATTTPAVVPAGKVLVIMGMRMNTASLLTTGMVVVRLRVNTGGVVAITSPVAAQMQCGSVAATAGLDSSQDITFGPQGLHIPAAAGVGLSFAGYVGATLTLQSFTTCEMWGYEYTL